MVTARQPIGRALRHRFLSILVGQASGPQTLYLGLATETLAADTLMETIEMAELEAPGYRRVAVPPSAWVVTSTPVAAQAEVTIRNTSETPWRGVAAAFLTTSQGNDGLLVATTPLRHGQRDLLPGDTIHLPMSIVYE